METSDQRSHLQELECQFGQGYYFARPLDAQAVEELMDNSIKDLNAVQTMPKIAPVAAVNVD